MRELDTSLEALKVAYLDHLEESSLNHTQDGQLKFLVHQGFALRMYIVSNDNTDEVHCAAEGWR